MMKNRRSIVEELLQEAQWHANQAEKLRQAAGLLREDEPEVTPAAQNGKLKVEDVAAAMERPGKKWRKDSIAKKLGVDVKLLDDLMTLKNGFEQHGYGWWLWKG